MTTATITISDMTWAEDRYDEEGKLAEAKYTFKLGGDLTGESAGRFLLAYTGGDPEQPATLEADYVGLERVTGALAGHSGSFVFATRGVHGGGKASTELTVVEGSGTGELAGLTGSASYVADAEEFTMTFEYQLP